MPLFASRSARVRPMKPLDVPRVLDIIRRFSEEDYEVARDSLRSDLTDQYVLTEGREVLGVCGARAIEGTDAAYWLSWTYLADAARGRGLGQQMMTEVFTRHGTRVAEVSKRWFDLGDTYGIDVAEGEDDVLILAAAVVVDQCCHEKR